MSEILMNMSMESRKRRVHDASMIQLPRIHANNGSISAVNNEIEIPFKTKRVYYLYDIPGGSERGGHGHKDLQQLIISICGSFEIILDDGVVKRSIVLNQPNEGIYLPSGLWRELVNFSSGAICLVLASDSYSEDDYFRDYEEFLKYKGVK